MQSIERSLTITEDGFFTEELQPTGVDGPVQKQKVLKKIPQEVIKNAVGLAIFTTMRSGLWISGAGGSGVLVARKEDGTWSPPSGIMLHTAGLGFLLGVDIYDCVVVINSRESLESFTKLRATLGGEISAVAGPVGVGGVLENDGMWKQLNRPVFTYLKSRGFYAGVQVDGTIIIERTDENERFYNERLGVKDILAGKVTWVPSETKMLMETLKMADGRKDVDQAVMEELEGQPAPGDVEVEVITPLFGIPEPDDPDPFGVHALEEAGLEIREAGSHSRPDSTQFEFRPSMSSPAFNHLNRRSVDTNFTSNRGSYMTNSKRNSTLSVVRSVSMGTQTDMSDLPPPTRTPSPTKSENAREELARKEPKETDYTQIDLGPYTPLANQNMMNGTGSRPITPPKQTTPQHTKEDSKNESDVDSDTTEDLDDDEPVIYEAAAATRARGSFVSPGRVNVVKAKGNVVNIPPKKPAPPLPARNTARASRTMSHGSTASTDKFRSPLASPALSDGFQNIDLNVPHYSPSRLAQQSAIREDSKEDHDDKNVKKPESDTEELNGDYVNSAIQTKLAPPSASDPETSSQSSKWNAASLPNSKRSSAVLESAPTTAAVSPTLENAADDKQLEEPPNQSNTANDTAVVADVATVPVVKKEAEPAKQEVEPMKEEFKLVEKEKETEEEKTAPVLDEAPPGAFPLDVVTPEPITEDKDVSRVAKLFSATENDTTAIDKATDAPAPTAPAPAPLPNVLKTLHDELDDVSESDDFHDAQDAVYSSPAKK